MRARSLVLASLVGCSLVDPLDDVSGGPAKKNLTDDGGAIANASQEGDDGGGAAPSGDGAVATLPPDPACPDEGEPNAPTPKSLEFKTMSFCGTVTSADTDMFVIDVPANAVFQIHLELPEGETVTARVSGNGNSSTSTSETNLQTNGGDGGPLDFVFSTSQTTKQKYVITLTRS